MIKEYKAPIKDTSLTNFSSYSGKGASKTKNLSVRDEAVLGSKNTYQRKDIQNAVNRRDVNLMREISNSFYSSDQTYIRVINYFKDMFLFAWSVTPQRAKTANKEALEETWFNILDYVEDINPEVLGPSIALKVLLEGAAYVAVKEKIDTNNGNMVGIQFLPIQYCRVTRQYRGIDLVDFNVKYFDDKYSNDTQRKIALELFPPTVTEAYLSYKRNPRKVQGSEWVTLDPDFGFRFALRADEAPLFIPGLLDLLDLKDVKDITMLKLEQELSKILVQKFDVDKDGHPIVDLSEMEAFHASAANMMGEVAGVDVLTTLADVDGIDLQSKSETSSNNPLSKATETVFNSLGVSHQLFNATTSGALAKSLSVDESFIFPLVKQFEVFANVRIAVNLKKLLETGLKAKEVKRLRFNFSILPVTYHNRSDMIKLYKEQTSLGYSKFLPAIALGQRQSEIMSALYFENDVLDLVTLMKPPPSSNTMSSATVETNKKGETVEQGRPEKTEEDRSEKTSQNRETM